MIPLQNISKYFIQHAPLFGPKVAPPQPNSFVHNLRQEVAKFERNFPSQRQMQTHSTFELKDFTILRCYAARWLSVQPTEAANEREFSFTGSNFESRQHYQTRDKLHIFVHVERILTKRRSLLGAKTLRALHRVAADDPGA